MGKKRRRLTEQERLRLEMDETVRPREGNKTAFRARIRKFTPLPQGAWSRLQRKASNQFDVLKAANTARGHTARTQLPEEGRSRIEPAPREQGAQEGSPQVDAGWGQGGTGQSSQPRQEETRTPGKLQARAPPTLSETPKAQYPPEIKITHATCRRQLQDPVPRALHDQ